MHNRAFTDSDDVRTALEIAGFGPGDVMLWCARPDVQRAGLCVCGVAEPRTRKTMMMETQMTTMTTTPTTPSGSPSGSPTKQAGGAPALRAKKQPARKQGPGGAGKRAKKGDTVATAAAVAALEADFRRGAARFDEVNGRYLEAKRVYEVLRADKNAAARDQQKLERSIKKAKEAHAAAERYAATEGKRAELLARFAQERAALQKAQEAELAELAKLSGATPAAPARASSPVMMVQDGPEPETDSDSDTGSDTDSGSGSVGGLEARRAVCSDSDDDEMVCEQCGCPEGDDVTFRIERASGICDTCLEEEA